MTLEIESLTRGISGDEYAQRMVFGFGIERVFDLFPPLPGGTAAIDRDAVVGPGQFEKSLLSTVLQCNVGYLRIR